jgi:glycosyltransferase involved in cell wall biosynthesis
MIYEVKMKIGYFIGHFPYIKHLNDDNYIQKYAHGGVETSAYNLALKMANKGDDVKVFTTSIDDKDSMEKEGNLSVYRYGTSFKVASANVSFKLLREPLKHHLDLVHAHSPIPYSDLSAYRHSRKNNIPMVLTYHFEGQETGGSFIRNSGVFLYNRLLLKRVLSQTDAIIVGTRAYYDSSKFLGPYREKVRIIPYGIDLEDFQGFNQKIAREKLGLSLEKKIILFFGSLVLYKGPDILLNAFKLVKEKFPNVQLIYAGRGPMEKQLQNLTRKLKLDNDVIFAGFVPEDLKPLYYHAADIFSLPSTNLAESFGIVNLEAMACGLPIVASNLGGMPEIVHDKISGLLVEPNDVEYLSNCLITILSDDDLSKDMGKEGKRLSKSYNWDRIVKLTKELYDELI